MSPCKGDLGGEPCPYGGEATFKVLSDSGAWLEQCDDCTDDCAREGLTVAHEVCWIDDTACPECSAEVVV